MARSDVAYPVTATYPEPVEHCEVCRWAVLCGPERRRDDHLSFVAGISTRQRQRLATRSAWTTVAALAELPVPVRPPVRGLRRPALERVREQARLQIEGRRQHRVLFELLTPVEAQRGLALLPDPSQGDLFFDIEGDPFVEEDGSDGLEYLFGVVDRRSRRWQTRLPCVLGDRSGGREARLRGLHRLRDALLERGPEPPHLPLRRRTSPVTSRSSWVSTRPARTRSTGCCGASGSSTCIGSSSRACGSSQESYSIKKLEPLYGLTREVELRDAGSSIVNFEIVAGWWPDQPAPARPHRGLQPGRLRVQPRAARLARGASLGPHRRGHGRASPGTQGSERVTGAHRAAGGGRGTRPAARGRHPR